MVCLFQPNARGATFGANQASGFGHPGMERALLEGAQTLAQPSPLSAPVPARPRLFPHPAPRSEGAARKGAGMLRPPCAPAALPGSAPPLSVPRAARCPSAGPGPAPAAPASSPPASEPAPRPPPHPRPAPGAAAAGPGSPAAPGSSPPWPPAAAGGASAAARTRGTRCRPRCSEALYSSSSCFPCAASPASPPPA